MYSPAVDRRKPQKLYCQLLEILRGPIEQGEWKVGSRIPTEEDICSRYNVSKTTVRVAIEQLVSLGYLQKVQGRGTFVRRRIPEESIRMAMYLNAEGAEFSAPHRCLVLESMVAYPGHDIADLLRLGRQELCRRLMRMQILESLPLAVENLYLPLRLCGAEPLGEEERWPLTRYIEERCTTRIQRLREKTDVVRAGEREAALLGLAPGTPVLRIRQIFFRSGDLPVACADIVRRVDRFDRILEFERL